MRYYFVHIAQLCTHQCPCNLNNRLKNNRTKQEVKLGGAGVNGVTGNHQNILLMSETVVMLHHFNLLYIIIYNIKKALPLQTLTQVLKQYFKAFYL